MLAVLLPETQIILLSGTQKMNKSTTHTRDYTLENGPGKITNSHYAVILEAILEKEAIEKRMIEICTECGKKKTNSLPSLR